MLVRLICQEFLKKLQYIFLEGAGGVVEGRSEIFRKFIRFGEQRLPLCIEYRNGRMILSTTGILNILYPRQYGFDDFLHGYLLLYCQ